MALNASQRIILLWFSFLFVLMLMGKQDLEPPKGKAGSQLEGQVGKGDMLPKNAVKYQVETDTLNVDGYPSIMWPVGSVGRWETTSRFSYVSKLSEVNSSEPAVPYCSRSLLDSLKRQLSGQGGGASPSSEILRKILLCNESGAAASSSEKENLDYEQEEVRAKKSEHQTVVGEMNNKSSSLLVQQLQNFSSEEGRSTMRSVTNLTSNTVWMVTSLRGGRYLHQPQNLLLFNGQRVDSQTLEPFQVEAEKKALQKMSPSEISSGKKTEGGKDELEVHVVDKGDHLEERNIEATYLLFGHGYYPGLRNPYTYPFGLNEQDKSSSKGKGRKLLNATGVKSFFETALHMTTNNSFRTEQRAESSPGDCLWLGFVTLQLGPEDSDAYRAAALDHQALPTHAHPVPGTTPPKPVAGPVFSASSVQGHFVSTCNLSFTVNTTLAGYLEVTEEAVTFSLWMIIAAPFTMYGFIRQSAFMKDSRSRTLRYSLLSCMWQLSIDFVCWVCFLSMAWTYTLASKALGAAAIAWFVVFSVFECRSYNQLVAAYKIHPDSYGKFTKVVLERPIGALYVLLFIVIIFIVELGVSMAYYLPLTIPLIFSFYVPQIIHGFLETAERNTLDLQQVYLVAIGKLLPLLTICLSDTETHFLRFQCNGAITAFTVLWLAAQCAVLHLQSVKGNKALLPAFLRPKKYSYAAVGPKHEAAINEEGAECPICKVPLSEAVEPISPEEAQQQRRQQQQSGGSSTAATTDGPVGVSSAAGGVVNIPPDDPVWVTPCGHYYHSVCLQEWMEDHTDCPLCRARLPTR